ncbi:MAG: bis(5'-nucleosyl)-tetraphosphatase (symmetrical) YqeK [Clostridia bacterium]|nr:bis(5'-nucleosyl)-tetraphosphatase (symmetrical) YqeK [Clostridia bacterium]
MTKEQEKRLCGIREIVVLREDARRFEHTMGVYRECLWMSRVFSLSDGDAYTLCAAALLHDIAKNLTAAEAIALSERHGVVLDTEIPSVIHQYTGAMLAGELFDMETVSPEMLDAIRCHTTGKADMTPIEKMLFVADFTEAGRKYRSCQEMREYLHGECEKINKNDKNARLRVLDEVTRRITGYTVTYLVERGKRIDPRMVEAWNSMV